MILDDFKCDNCGFKDTYSKPTALSEYETFICPECGTVLRKIIAIGGTSIGEGLCGNQKNGYSTGFINKCSNMGKYKGVKIKKGG